MSFDPAILDSGERTGFALRALYHGAGYAQFKMGKFEEYDLYARNKDFLISGNVLTFTDVGGRLMALKPDVTLSIVRAGRDCPPGSVRKLYYHENVYRPGPSGAFRELAQVGVECQGDVGEAEIAETLLLALRSLACVSDEYRLEISHLGILSALLDRLTVPEAQRRAILDCAARKSPHELARLCRAAGADGAAAEDLRRLVMTSGAPEAVLPLLRGLNGCAAGAEALERLAAAAEADGFGARLSLDFSIVSNTNYYNGVVFRGFVRGAPARVLSGGQYDGLMRKMGRADRAVGFAVYLDQLEYLSAGGEERI